MFQALSLHKKRTEMILKAVNSHPTKIKIFVVYTSKSKITQILQKCEHWEWLPFWVVTRKTRQGPKCANKWFIIINENAKKRKGKFLEAQEQSVPMTRKSSSYVRRPAVMNKELLAKLKLKIKLHRR